MRIPGTITLMITIVGALSACSDSTRPDSGGTFYGPSVVMAAGSARAYVTLDRAGTPIELGVAFGEAALTGLPSVSTEYVFALPVQAAATAFKHATINWQPQGHPPPMIYTVPHFDFHFYSIPEADRLTILLGDSLLLAKMTRQPAAAFVPAGYVTGMSTAQMGMHWNDPEAPERKGEPFTKSFIYGSYDGTFIFAEPMVSKAFLDTKPAAVVTAIKLPSQYATRGYQATSYTVVFDGAAKEYRMALTDLVLR